VASTSLLVLAAMAALYVGWVTTVGPFSASPSRVLTERDNGGILQVAIGARMTAVLQPDQDPNARTVLATSNQGVVARMSGGDDVGYGGATVNFVAVGSGVAVLSAHVSPPCTEDTCQALQWSARVVVARH
jgi:hypothetical protein